jgi:hypothetical protein
MLRRPSCAWVKVQHKRLHSLTLESGTILISNRGRRAKTCIYSTLFLTVSYAHPDLVSLETDQVPSGRYRPFYFKCMKHLEQSGKSWVLLTDTDEFVNINSYQMMIPPITRITKRLRSRNGGNRNSYRNISLIARPNKLERNGKSRWRPCWNEFRPSCPTMVSDINAHVNEHMHDIRGRVKFWVGPDSHYCKLLFHCFYRSIETAFMEDSILAQMTTTYTKAKMKILIIQNKTKLTF